MASGCGLHAAHGLLQEPCYYCSCCRPRVQTCRGRSRAEHCISSLRCHLVFFSVLLLPPAVDSQLHPLLRVCCHPCRVLQPPASLESNHPGALMSVGLCSRPRLHGPDKPSAFVVFCCLNISVSCIPQLKSGLILRGAGGGCVTARRNQHNT